MEPSLKATPGGSRAQRSVVARCAQRPTNPPKAPPKVSVRLSRTSVESVLFEELEKHSFGPGAWRNSFGRGAGGVPVTAALGIQGLVFVFVNKAQSENRANFGQEPGNLPSY